MLQSIGNPMRQFAAAEETFDPSKGWLYNCIIQIWININIVSNIFINIFVDSVGKKQYAYDNIVLQFLVTKIILA